MAWSKMVWICKNTVSQSFMLVQHNVCALECHLFQAINKVEDIVKFY